MTNRILGPNGDPLPPSSPSEKPPANVGDMVRRARTMWRTGDKQAAFEQMCEVNLLLNKGVARCLMDLAELKQKVTPK